MESQFKEPLHDEVFGVMNYFFRGKEPRYNEPTSTVPWHFVKSRFHCIIKWSQFAHYSLFLFYCAEKCKITLGGGGVEVDIHVEVIEVITVGLLVHIRISNHASNNMTLSTGALKY